MTQQAPARRNACKRLTVVLIRPSKHDDEGYVIRHFRGVLPSNTLACLYSLTEDLKRRRTLGDNLQIRIRIFDDTVQSIPVDSHLWTRVSFGCAAMPRVWHGYRSFWSHVRL